MTPIIFHNPRCSTSRNALAIMRASGEVPEVVEYLKNPPSRDYLVELLDKMQLTAKDIIRQKEVLYKELSLDAADVTEDQLIDAMIQHPKLINRPIVVTDKGAVLCRPLERIFTVLANPVSEFTKENGDVINNPNA